MKLEINITDDQLKSLQLDKELHNIINNDNIIEILRQITNKVITDRFNSSHHFNYSQRFGAKDQNGKYYNVIDELLVKIFEMLVDKNIDKIVYNSKELKNTLEALCTPSFISSIVGRCIASGIIKQFSSSHVANMESMQEIARNVARTEYQRIRTE